MSVEVQPELVGGRFVLEQLAGSGGMGSVYRARDVSTGGAVAVKVLHGHEKSGDADRFAREATLLAELCHPAIVGFITNGLTGRGEPFIAMEWLDGETLAARLARGALEPHDAIRLIALLARAIAFAHDRGVVHRDLKPANIFLVDGRLDHPKVLDFGIARLVRPDARITTSGAMVGTPGYVSPEQARSDHDVDARSDIFSLGCLLFRAVSGRLPWIAGDAMSMLIKLLMEPAPRLRHLVPGAPPALEELVDRMLAKQPEHRPQSALALANELDCLADQDRLAESRQRSREKTQASLLPARGCLLLMRLPPGAGATPLALGQHPLAREAKVDERAKRFGGTFLALGYGSFLVHFSAGPSLSESVVTAAHCALALRPIVPEMQIALVCERPGMGTLVGSNVIEDGIALLDQLGREGVVLDRAAAALVATRFALLERGNGYLLREAPSQPAVEAATVKQPRSRRRLGLFTIVLLCGGAALVGAATAVALALATRASPPRAPKSPKTARPAPSLHATSASAPSVPPAPTSAPPSEVSWCRASRCVPLEVPDVHHIDAWELIPKARASVGLGDLRMVSITTTFNNADGTVDLTRPREGILYSMVGSDGNAGISAMPAYNQATGEIAMAVTIQQGASVTGLEVERYCGFRAALAQLPPTPYPVGGTAVLYFDPNVSAPVMIVSVHGAGGFFDPIACTRRAPPLPR